MSAAVGRDDIAGGFDIVVVVLLCTERKKAGQSQTFERA